MSESTRNDSDLPVLGGKRISRPTAVVALVVFSIPPIAWLGSLGLSYVVQDFTCSAAASADRSVPGTTLLTLLLVLNIVLLATTIASGIVSALLIRRHRDDDRRTLVFFGVTGVGNAILFGLGIVAIALGPLVYGAC